MVNLSLRELHCTAFTVAYSHCLPVPHTGIHHAYTCNLLRPRFSDEQGWRVIRTLAAAEGGEEMTIDYELGRGQMKPGHERRAKLMEDKGFTCMCVRCAAVEGDDTRRFHCQVTLAPVAEGAWMLDGFGA